MNISKLKDIAGRFNINDEEAKRIARTVNTEKDFITVWEQENWWTDEIAISAQCLNGKGRQHVKDEIKRLGLDWDVAEAITEIETEIVELLTKFEREDDKFYFENWDEIEITSDMVHFEDTTQ